MPDLITVGSRAHTAIRISERAAVPPSEGAHVPLDAPPPQSFVLNGGNHPEAVRGVGVTHGVDAGVFHAWLDEEKKAKSPLADMVFEMRQDDEPEKDSPVAVKQTLVDQPEPAPDA